jgi:O-antigen/teichoic acid export membrane protein
MKIDWKFAGVFLGLGFALGFAKPSLSSSQHFWLTIISYGVLAYFYRKQSAANKSKSRLTFEKVYWFLARIIIYFSILTAFNLLIIYLPQWKDILIVPYFIFLVTGLVYCFSETTRMYAHHYAKNILSKDKN